MAEDTEDFMEGLGDTLGEAYDEATAEAPERPRDEHGKFVSTNADGADDGDEGEEEIAEESAADELDNEDEGEHADDDNIDSESTETDEATPPAGWDNELRRAAFASASPELRAEIAAREDEMEKGVTRLKEQYEGKASLADEFSEIVRPYEGQIRAEGATPLQAVQTLLNTAQILRTGSPQQKEAVIRQTAQQFGVNLAHEPGDPSLDGTDPNVAALQKQVADLTNFITQQQQQTVQQQQQGILSEIEAFSAAKDEKGEPLRPHYSAVEGDMIPLIASIRSASPGKSNAEVLTEAYDRAVWANPETRKLSLEAQVKAAEEKRLKDAAEAATKAKKSKNVKSTGTRPGGGVKASVKPSDWDDDLSEAFDRAS